MPANPSPPVFTLEATSRLEVGVALPQNVAESLPLDRGLQARAWPPDRPSTVFPLVYREHSTLTTPAGSVYRLLFSLARPFRGANHTLEWPHRDRNLAQATSRGTPQATTPY